MGCTNKWCAWLQAFSQIAVAIVIVYAGIIVNKHMESWTTSFERGSDDLHSIRNNMNNIAYSMESINNDMDGIKTQMETMSLIGNDMNTSIRTITNNMLIMTQQMDSMNNGVGRMNNKFSPGGMFGSMSPF
jgi:methyl-accepting chemotaxis protein